MKVVDVGEFGLIDILRRMLSGDRDDLVQGIGDDAAIFQSSGDRLWAYTIDAMVEGIHFDLDYVSWHALGYKALAINLSDLAAVGGPASSYALVNLGIPDKSEVEAIEEMYRGLRECGDEYSCAVVGGDIVRSPQQVFVCLSLIGPISGGRFLARSAARPGQAVAVTGLLGDSYLGLKWLQDGRGGDNQCARKHLYPQPRLAEGRESLALGAKAAIDISDGLLRDLGHICEESGVGVNISLNELPLSDAAVETAAELGEDPYMAALLGGEDYELVLTADGRDMPMLEEELGVYVIGEVSDTGRVRVLDSSGNEVVYTKKGYEHFQEG
jgi:thiamine-monophosphate kinase